MSTWEARMSARSKVIRAAELAARDRDRAERRRRHVERSFLPLYEATDPDEILPQILAARCLGIRYGDPGPVLEPGRCRQCWGERHVWLGNTWGLDHKDGSVLDCRHECHDGETWMA